MTIPAKIVAGAGHVTVGTGLNLLGTAVNTTENLVGLVADTGKDLLDTLKNPLKKDVWKAIGNRHKSRIKNFTAHQKAKFVEYTEPLKIKGAKRNTINQLARGSGTLTHAVTGGDVLAVATALDAGWRGVASPFVGVANRFRKKDKKIKLWEKFRKNQKKRKEKFDSGFSELKGEVKEKIDEAVDKVNEEVKEVLEEKEDFVEEEIKRNRKNDNKEKEKAWEKAKEKGKKENTSADSVGQKNSEQKQITAEEQRVKAEIEEIKGSGNAEKNNYKIYENEKMKAVLGDKLNKYTEGDSSKFKILYPGSHTDITPAKVFSKDNVDFLDNNEESMKKLSSEGYNTITQDLSKHTKEYDLVIESRSQTKGEDLAKNIKKGGYIVVENAHAKGNYFDQNDDFKYVANLSKDTQEPYKKVPEDNPITSGDTDYYLFKKVA